MKIKCLNCEHSDVCKYREVYFEIEKMCREADVKCDEIRVELTCRHFETKE